MESKRNEVLLDTSVSSCNSLLYFCTDESDVGSFIGDNMTSDSASFEGFDMGLASSELVAPSGSIVKNKIYENKTSEVTTVTDSGANLPSLQQIVSNEFNVVDNSSTKDERPISTRVSVSSENIRNDILEQSNINKTSTTANFNRVEIEHGSEATLFVNNSEVVKIGHSNLISIPQNEYFPKQNGKYENKKGLEVGKQNTNMDYQYSPTLSRDQNNDLGYEIIATEKSSECNFSGKKVVSNADFKVDFGVLKDISTCHPFLDIPQVDSEKNSHEVVPPSMLALHVNNSIETQTKNLTPKQTDRDLTNTITDNTTDIQTGKTQLQTDMTVDRQTENLNISVMFDMLFKKIEIVNNKLTEQKETSFNVSKQVIGAVTNVEDQLVELGTDVKHKLEGLDHKFTTLQNDFEQCKVEIISLKSDVAQNAHQIEFISTQVKENTKMINEVKEGSDKIELHLAEKLLSCSLNLDRKNDVVKEEVNQNKMLVRKMSIDLQQAREELDDLKSKYHRLEGAINQNRDQSNLLNNQLTGLAQNMICGSTKDPMLIESLLHQLSPQSVTKMDNHKTSATPQPVVYKVDTLPSISSTPVVSPNFCAPQTIVNQPYANQYPLSYSPRHVSEEEAIMKDIRKREKAPSFDGTSTSAPQFILEVKSGGKTQMIMSGGWPL